MRGFSRKLIIVGIAASVMTALAAPAFAFARIVVPSTLNDAQRARALSAPLGDTGPFGRPAEPGAQWSRLQVPTSQGLQWVDVESRSAKD
jgi:hypothetical protein